MSQSLDPTCSPMFGQPYMIVTFSDSLLVVYHLHSENVFFLIMTVKI